ncbi:uncharacterized protein SCHCODRAFT_02697461 [Schizophyllum commune H4-8]|nr:uncharacterized protein SCHCODRAFT_02697461 [Schizophyllum commune H4-8]KAI5895941.1 hypothetical protein SCHCODRAFT_02697461 [Schizophyllum commune H4-8]
MPPKKRVGPSAKAQNSRKKSKGSDGKPIRPPPSPSLSRPSSLSPPPSTIDETLSGPCTVSQLCEIARMKSCRQAQDALLKQYRLQTRELSEAGLTKRAGHDPIRQLTIPCTIVDRHETPLLVFIPNLFEGAMLEHINKDSTEASLHADQTEALTVEKLVETLEGDWVPEQLSTFNFRPNSAIVGQALNAALLKIDELHALDVMDIAQRILEDHPATKELFLHDRTWLNSCIYYFRSGSMNALLSPPAPLKAWRFLVVSGEFSGGELYCPQLMVKLSLQPGHVVAFRGDVEWKVSSSEGFRAMAMYYTSAAVWDRYDVVCS